MEPPQECYSKRERADEEINGMKIRTKRHYSECSSESEGFSEICKSFRLILFKESNKFHRDLEETKGI
ncbi:hypothetical protein SUGI_0423620 [Cryptomeria japonica]|nr:hypothetical protein SUGI_0423620 [Cryptomeria japonica]